MKWAVLPMGRGKSTMASILQASGSGVYLSASLVVMVRACGDLLSGLKQAAPILFHGCGYDKPCPVLLNISFRNFRSEFVPVGMNGGSLCW